jgi:hypothetical protein
MTYAPSTGGFGAAKYTQPADRDSTGGRPSNFAATGPSVATMIAFAVMLCPLANVTEPEDTAVTAVLR